MPRDPAQPHPASEAPSAADTHGDEPPAKSEVIETAPSGEGKGEPLSEKVHGWAHRAREAGEDVAATEWDWHAQAVEALEAEISSLRVALSEAEKMAAPVHSAGEPDTWTPQDVAGLAKVLATGKRAEGLDQLLAGEEKGEAPRWVCGCGSESCEGTHTVSTFEQACAAWHAAQEMLAAQTDEMAFLRAALVAEREAKERVEAERRAAIEEAQSALTETERVTRLAADEIERRKTAERERDGWKADNDRRAAERDAALADLVREREVRELAEAEARDVNEQTRLMSIQALRERDRAIASAEAAENERDEWKRLHGVEQRARLEVSEWTSMDRVAKIEAERDAALREAQTAKSERDKWYDCHAGPGTTVEACGACVTYLGRELTAAHAAKAAACARAEVAEESLSATRAQAKDESERAEAARDEAIEGECARACARDEALRERDEWHKDALRNQAAVATLFGERREALRRAEAAEQRLEEARAEIGRLTGAVDRRVMELKAALREVAGSRDIAEAHVLVGIKANGEHEIGPWTHAYDAISEVLRKARALTQAGGDGT